MIVFFPTWFVIDSETDSDRALAKLSPFLVGKALKAQIGSLKTVRRLQSGAILVEASNRSQREQLHKLSHLAHTPVTCSPHRTLNICKGVVRCKELLLCDKQEIIE